MIKVYTKNIRKELGLMTSERRQHLLSLLCVIRREKAERIKIEDKQNRVILAGVFLQYVLYKYCEADSLIAEKSETERSVKGDMMQVIATDDGSLLDVINKEAFSAWCRSFRYELEDCGKPYLPEYPLVQFNLSHSGDWVVVAVGDETVGIDVEKRVDANKCKDIAKRFFHPDEVVDLDQYEDEMLEQRFLQYWTCKEAYVKYLGTGLRTPLNQFCVDTHFQSVKTEVAEKSDPATLSIYSLDEEYELAVCNAK